MTITAHAGWTNNPVSNPNATITHSLPLASQTYSVFGGAVDSANPSASFTFAWSILLPRTGQTASLSSSTTQNPTLQNVSDIWGDLRLFLVATNPATGETSETDPKIAPASAFCTLQIESAARSLRLPAIGSRDWYTALDTITNTLDTLTINNGISSATVNAAGELIITLDDASTINAGVVKGADGADGAAGAAGAAGPSVRRYNYSATVTHWYDPNNTTLYTGFQPVKTDVIAGPWLAPVNLDLLHLNVSCIDGGNASNKIKFHVISATPANWELGNLTTLSLNVELLASSNHVPLSAYSSASSSIAISAGSLIGVMMEPLNVNSKMHQISVHIMLEDS